MKTKNKTFVNPIKKNKGLKASSVYITKTDSHWKISLTFGKGQDAAHMSFGIDRSEGIDAKSIKWLDEEMLKIFDKYAE